ncbi:hypothetical protein C8R43DRAFT_908981 [Mycena crocata]|nr:hypothetical protein C8R43DRAFT_908981 [Mycena crocata]
MESSHGAPAERGLLHVEYLQSYWLSFDLWASWSDFGRYAAAGILGCDFEGVLPTTNHLESFNGLLKRKYLRRWQRGGRRLRLDVLIQIIVVQVLPAVFAQRCMQAAEPDRISEWILALPGGQHLLEQRRSGQALSVLTPVAYFVPDASRDAAALQLLQNNQISTPTFDAGTFSFTCYSSFATESDASPVAYAVEVRLNGTASCTGPDFEKNGGACKHIRAGLLKIAALRAQVPDIPSIYLPTSEQEARVLQARFTLHSAQTELSTISSTSPPTVAAAQKIDELLGPDGIAYEEEGDEPENEEELNLIDSDDDNESVVTDASFDGDELNVDNFVSTFCLSFSCRRLTMSYSDSTRRKLEQSYR